MYGKKQVLSTPRNKLITPWTFDLIFIICIVGLFYATGLGSYPLFTPDEGRYSEVAREMLVSGDFITPRLNGVGFFDKPVLYYWLQASALKIFGLNEWALRFWPALIGVFGCVMVYITGHMLFGRRSGLISASILATSFLYFGTSHYANLDLEVAVFISASLLFFIIGIQQSRPTFILLFYIFAGFAALTKGLIGVAFPVMIIGAWILLLNKWSLILKMRIVTGSLIFLMITAPWYLLVQKANPHFFEFFFIFQQFSRFLTTATFNNVAAPWFYGPIILFGFMPWTLFIVQAFCYHLKTIWQNKKNHSAELFLLLWAIIVFTFFSIPTSKTIGYITPIFPALALLVGQYLNVHWDKLKNKGMMTGVISFLFLTEITAFIMVSAAPDLFPDDYRMIPYSIMSGFLFLIASIATYFLLKRNRFSNIFYCITTTTAIFLILLIHCAHIINHKTIKPLATIIKSQLKPDDEVITYFRYYQDLPIYLERRITIAANWQAKDIPLYDNWQRELWYNMPYQDTSAWLINEKEFWERWKSDKRIFVLMHNDFYKNFIRKLQINTENSTAPYPLGAVELGKHDHVILMSNKKN